MQTTAQHYKTFNIIGIPLRTTNANDEAAKTIPPLWEKFRNEDIPTQIPNRIGEEVIALYTDYEGGFEDPYTLVIGCPVSSTDEVPAGMVAKTIPAAHYTVFPVSGQFPESLIATWETIWQSDLDYAFTHSFERYSGRMVDGQPEVSVYMAM